MWQAIETAPKDGTRMLLGRFTDGKWQVWLGKRPIGFTAFDQWQCDEGWEIDPTHWAPLPAPPEVPS